MAPSNIDPSDAPLDPVEALMSIRVIIDATDAETNRMPLEVGLRLIDDILTKALPTFKPRELRPEDDAGPPS